MFWKVIFTLFVFVIIYGVCCQAYSDFKWYHYGKDGVDDDDEIR